MSVRASVAPFDPHTMLAMSMHASPGVYALLVGSGISRSSGVLTGWGVIEALVRRMAAVDSGAELSDDFDAEQWWSTRYPDVELGYGAVLEASGMSAADRRSLLEPFFVPTDEELAAGTKKPSPAHHAIAQLVKRGTVRVIVTTNFDDLIEKALDEIGAPHQVVASPAMIEGCEPPRHAACTVIKVHGDYTRLDQLNTEAELAAYEERLDQLLDVVFDEYGLVVCGWSADWDRALGDAIRRAPSRRYPMYWATISGPGSNATDLVSSRRGTVVQIADADTFLTELVEHLEIIDRMANPPLTRDLAIGKLKRYLPDPVRRIDLRDLVFREIDRIRALLADRSLTAPEHHLADLWHVELDTTQKRAEILMDMVAQGVLLDIEREHDSLWIEVVQQLMRARRRPQSGESHNELWVRMAGYPAFLVLKAASFAAVAAGRDDLLIRLHLEPTAREPGLDNGSAKRDVPAVGVLYEYRLTESSGLTPTLQTRSQKFPISRLVRDVLEPIITPLVGDKDSFELLTDRVEFRIALIQQYIGRPLVWFPAFQSLCHVWQFDENGWRPALDFAEAVNDEVWMDGLKLAGETFDKRQDALATLVTSLRQEATQNKIF